MESEKKIFNEQYKQKHFNILEVTFWDPLEKIKENYEALTKLLQGNSEKSELIKKNFNLTTESINESYNLLSNIEERQKYLAYLKFYYFLCEPVNLSQLKKNYNNKLFPFFLFTVKIKEKQQISTMIIDFVEKKITIAYKDKEFYNILSDNIITVNKKFGTTIIIMAKNDNKNKSKKDEFKEIVFEPELSQQISLIYTIISYFAKSIEDNNFYDLLEDDSYRPCGIILRSKIIKDHRVKVLGKDDRYAVLGPSMIVIYKDEDMQEIRNVLPLVPFFMRINFLDKEKKIIFKYPTREQAVSFYDEENYKVWMTTIKQIFNRRIKSKMDNLEIFQANENKDKEKIIKEIGIEIQCAQEEINELKKKLENTEQKFMEKVKK